MDIALFQRKKKRLQERRHSWINFFSPVKI